MEVVITIQNGACIIPITGQGTIHLAIEDNLGRIYYCGQGFSIDIYQGAISNAEYHFNEIGKAIELNKRLIQIHD